MTRRSRRELERAAERLEGRRPDDGGAPQVSAGFVEYEHHEVEVVEEGADDEPTTFDVVLIDADGEVVERAADDEATGRRESDGSDGAAEDPERDDGGATDGVEGEDTAAADGGVETGDEPEDDPEDDEPEPIEVRRRLTGFRRRQFAEGRGRQQRPRRFY